MVHTSLGSIFQRLPWHSNGGHVCCSVGKQNSASLGPCLTHVLRVSLWLWLRLVTMQDRQKIMFNCLFKKNLLYWSIVDLQFYASFCTAKWISYIFTYIYINIYLYIYILFSYFFLLVVLIFAMLCWFLWYDIVNQPQLYIDSLPIPSLYIITECQPGFPVLNRSYSHYGEQYEGSLKI